MPRGNRYYLSGYVWHITHRCHKREFFLKFARDRRRWLQWLGEAWGSQEAFWEEFKGVHRGWALEKQGWRKRQPQWTESIAVGGEGFVRETKERLGAKAMWREVVGENGTYELRESLTSYEDDCGPKNVGLRFLKGLLLGHIFLKNNNLAGSDPEVHDGMSELFSSLTKSSDYAVSEVEDFGLKALFAITL